MLRSSTRFISRLLVDATLMLGGALAGCAEDDSTDEADVEEVDGATRAVGHTPGTHTPGTHAPAVQRTERGSIHISPTHVAPGLTGLSASGLDAAGEADLESVAAPVLDSDGDGDPGEEQTRDP